MNGPGIPLGPTTVKTKLDVSGTNFMDGKLRIFPVAGNPSGWSYDASGQSMLDISGGMDVSGGNARFLFDWSDNIIDLSTNEGEIFIKEAGLDSLAGAAGTERPRIRLRIKDMLYE